MMKYGQFFCGPWWEWISMLFSDLIPFSLKRFQKIVSDNRFSSYVYAAVTAVTSA